MNVRGYNVFPSAPTDVGPKRNDRNDSRDAKRDFAFYDKHPEWDPELCPTSNRYADYGRKR